jgi:hypothetical protein
VKHYAAFQSNLVEGTGRYVSVTLADGTPLPIRTTESNQTRCEPDPRLRDGGGRSARCGAARGAGRGLVIDYRPDNGAVTRATAPAAYVRGYLEAVDRASR